MPKFKKNTIDSLQWIIRRNYKILLIIQLQCYYISSLKQYKTSGSRFTLERITIDYHQNNRKIVINTPDIGYSFSINPSRT